ncbi:MAG: glycosyl hydrolase family 95 catalytic domain-containing protein, partial [Clostridia bacterium]
MKKLTALITAFSMIAGYAASAANISEREVNELSKSTWGKRSYSSTYTEVTTLDGESGRDGWRDGLVTGNGENGVMESCGPATDVMIFQNMKFAYPTNAIRMTPDMSSVREETMRDILNYNGEYLSKGGAQAASDAMVGAAGEWVREMNIADKWELQYTYAFHPAHQLRLQMEGAANGEEASYERYTDYMTAEIGTNWTDKNGVSYERKTFASREDNVNITSLKSRSGGKINLTVSIDDIARMSNEGGVGTKLADLRYRKVADYSNADYIGISAHYPFYKNSEFNEVGFGGITRIVIKGGSKKYVFGSETADNFANPKGGATDTEMNLGYDKNPSIRITGADEVYLITKTDMGFDIGTLGEFEKSAVLPEYINRLIADTAEVVEKYGGKNFDYEKALAVSAEKHSAIMGRLTYAVCTDDKDIAMRSCTNEELIAAQQASKDKLLPAMLERLYYNGRYAAVCSSGIQAPRLGGMWTGAWGCAWSGDYTTDANINLQIAGANIGSLQEETIGFMNVMLKNITDWQLNARQVYGIDDALLAPPRTDGHSAVLNHFGSWPGQMWLSGAAWLIYPMYEYYQCFGNQNIPLTEDIRKELEFTGNLYEGYTETLDKYGTKGDYHDYDIRDNITGERVIYNMRNTLGLSDERAEEILTQGYFDLEKDILYPLVTKTAKFFIDFVDPRYYVRDGVAFYDENHTEMAEGDGWYIAPSYSPENTPANTGKGYTANAAMDSAASRNMMEIAEELENKLDYEGREERIERYRYYAAHIPEYLYEDSGELKEWTLSAYTENYGHRHGSQLYGLWPLHEAETDTKLFAGAKKLIETKNSVPTGDGKSGHGWLHRGLTMARLKDGGGVKDTLLPLVSNKMIYTSMMMSHNNDGTSAYCTDP